MIQNLKDTLKTIRILYNHYFRRRIYFYISPLWLIVLFCFFLALYFLAVGAGIAHGAEVPNAPDYGSVTKAVMNEASNQGYSGMVAHAFLFKNRLSSGMSLGSSGLNSKRVEARLAKEHPNTWSMAKKVVRDVFSGEIQADPTEGAVFCENTRHFGVPKFIQKALKQGTVKHTVRVKDVDFWAKK